MNRKYYLSLLLLLSQLFFAATGYAQTASQQVDKIIAMKEAPDGVVFEIVTGGKNGLKWALPKAKKLITRLRKKFPGIDVAIVTHGREQFALQKSNDKKYKEVHALSKQLVQDNVPVHVCGTFAEWQGVSEEEFPDYVNVAAEGPAAIKDYVSLGYILVKL